MPDSNNINQSKLDKSLQDEIVKRVKSKFHIKEIILFGSNADGEPGESSDIDLVIILEDHGFADKYWDIIERRINMTRLLIDIERNTPMDILIYTQDEWKRLIEKNTSFINDINKLGVRIA
jgi:uncharacterized protein